MSDTGQTSIPARPYVRITRFGRDLASGWNRIGRQVQFYAQTLRSIGDVLIHYRSEVVRLLVELGQGTQALVRVGGTLMVYGALLFLAGIASAQTLFSVLGGIGVDALAGFIAIPVVRAAVPVVGITGLSATIGAAATAQLGAMRINEEIDALEVIGVRTVAYLASTRLIAGTIVAIPMFCVAMVFIFAGMQALLVGFYGLSSGVYHHYFREFLYTTDLLWTLLLLLLSAFLVMLIHTYYGYTASGGPAGVGEAVGRAVRASMVAAIFMALVVTMVVYGTNPNINL